MSSFFGLDHKYLETVYDEIFFLKYHGNWSFIEAYNLPIGLRHWFIERLVKQKEMEQEAQEEASRNR
tara:strand:- start:1691 stop:1891 length:201 start_codon:yes stop_codon:yes gene_type:complete